MGAPPCRNSHFVAHTWLQRDRQEMSSFDPASPKPIHGLSIFSRQWYVAVPSFHTVWKNMEVSINYHLQDAILFWRSISPTMPVESHLPMVVWSRTLAKSTDIITSSGHNGHQSLFHQQIPMCNANLISSTCISWFNHPSAESHHVPDLLYLKNHGFWLYKLKLSIQLSHLGLFHEFLQLLATGGQHHLVAQHQVAIRALQLHIAEELRAPQDVQASGEQAGMERDVMIQMSLELSNNNELLYIYISHRVHGAGIYANMTGVYGWDPCYHI